MLDYRGAIVQHDNVYHSTDVLFQREHTCESMFGILGVVKIACRLKGLSGIRLSQIRCLCAYPQPKSFSPARCWQWEKDFKAVLLPFSPRPVFGRGGTTCVTSRRQEEGQS